MVHNIKNPLTPNIAVPKILLDTNILVHIFYNNLYQNTTNISRQYQNYVNHLITKKEKLYTTEFNIYEMYHVIDKINRDIYSRENGQDISLKEYHKNQTEVKKVHKEFKASYDTLKNCIQILPYQFEKEDIDDFCEKDESSLDFYDYMLLKVADKEKFKYILTDDADFVSNLDYIKNFDIMTQNNEMIKTYNDKSQDETE